MLERFTEAVFSYSFAILDLLGAFLERTHAVVGLGMPMLVMALVQLFLPQWVEVGVWVFVLGPAAAAAVTITVHGLLSTRSH
jgi:hypothetical protein